MTADPSWHRRVLADLPTVEQLVAETEAKYDPGDDGWSEAAWVYFGSRMHGLYAQARGLLEALVEATDPRDASK